MNTDDRWADEPDRRFQAKGIPEPLASSYPVSKFVIQNACSIALRILYADAARLYRLHFVYPHYASFSLIPSLWQRIALGIAVAFDARSTIEVGYLFLSSIAVLIGWGTPADWPPMFDSISNTWSVRRYWSRYWHQMMRLAAEPIVKGLLHKTLGIKHGTVWSNYGHVFGNFFVAFVCHGFPKHVVGGNWKTDWNFFMGMAVAILLEDMIAAAAEMLGWKDKDGRLTRTFGYTWTWAVTSLLWLSYVDETLNASKGKPAFGVTLLEPLLEMISGSTAV